MHAHPAEHAGHHASEPPDAAAHDPSGSGAQARAAQDRHEGHSVAMFQDRFSLSLLLTIPVLVWSPDLQGWLGYEAPTFPGSDLIPALLGSLDFAYGGSVFLRGAVPELSDRQPGMMTLISMAILVAFATSWAATLGMFEVEIWWELATLITIMLLGHWLEMRSIAQARGALAALAELLPDTPERVADDGIDVVPLGSLAVGDLVLVRPGGRVPADGTVEEGHRRRRRTLTRGEPMVAAVPTVAGVDEERLLALAAAVEADSEHPLARAIIRASEQRGAARPTAEAFEALAGRGAQATVEGHPVAVGGPRLLTEFGLEAAVEPAATTRGWAADGRTVLYVTVDARVRVHWRWRTRSAPSPLWPSSGCMPSACESR